MDRNMMINSLPAEKKKKNKHMDMAFLTDFNRQHKKLEMVIKKTLANITVRRNIKNHITN